MKRFLLLVFLTGCSLVAGAQDVPYETKQNVRYYSNAINQSDTYINERCALDFYFPKNRKGFATIVWFHGGGLTGGSKEIPASLKGQGVAVVAVNYRLYPKAKSPAYIQDAAAAVSWVFKNIESFGGDPSLVFVSGHSAGGYLASMIGLDKSWLKQHNIDADRIAGLIPFSGHTITHMTVREEQGIPDTQPTVDKLAPLYHVRSDAPPLLLITGDRELEMLGRYEENAYMMRMMKIAGHKETVLLELDGYDHGGMAYPAFPLLLKEVRRITEKKKK
ncbi:alpha/beta hydrolase [Pontibacter sp. SGAir0037]|uniref:alpha/beta hydrolase n=1 Tax=Pontibacter sp. SGAir0037 TaxID=2571030 RepID=UPI0010CCE021|nr:alpha/beta hydrolase [Pontibacter sp. SGAir0037]QCR22299.1 lipase [Pontibacter sp. SGAir0037]